jgi:MoxR-like ATPase
MLPQIASALTPDVVIRIQTNVRAVYVSDPVLDYAQALIGRTRDRMDLKLGLSPRAGQGLIRAAQAWTYLANRNAVLPDDIQAVLPAVVSHRLEYRADASPNGGDGHAIANELIRAVPVPV